MQRYRQQHPVDDDEDILKTNANTDDYPLLRGGPL